MPWVPHFSRPLREVGILNFLALDMLSLPSPTPRSLATFIKDTPTPAPLVDGAPILNFPGNFKPKKQAGQRQTYSPNSISRRMTRIKTFPQANQAIFKMQKRT
jgi:hypothetical protein